VRRRNKWGSAEPGCTGLFPERHGLEAFNTVKVEEDSQQPPPSLSFLPNGHIVIAVVAYRPSPFRCGSRAV